MNPAEAEPWRACRSSQVGGKGPGCAENTAKETPTRERGRPARMHRRRDSLSLPTMYPPTNAAGRNGVRPAEAEPRRDCRSSRVGEEGPSCAENTAEETPTRERGRLARMHCRSVSRRTPAMVHRPTPPSGTACARPKQNPGAIAGRVGLEEKGQGFAENTAEETPTRERGRLARMHRRRDSLSMPTMYHPPTPPA